MKKLICLAVALSMIFSLSAPAFAADKTWLGTTSGAWATVTNWVGGGPVPGTGDIATFNAADGAAPSGVIDLGAGVTIKTILFDTAAADPYTIGSGGVGVQDLILNDSGAITVGTLVDETQSINADVVLGTTDAISTFTITSGSTVADKTLTLAGTLTGRNSAHARTLAFTGLTGTATLVTGVIDEAALGTVAVTKDGAGTLTLNAANGYAGGTTLSAGTLNAIINAAALGTGTLTITGGTLQLGNETGTVAFGRATTVSNAATINSGRVSSDGVGTTNSLGTLSTGAFTLTAGLGDSKTTSGVQGLTFGAVTLTGNATIAATNSRAGGTGLLTLGTVNSDGTTDRAFTITAAGTDDVTVGAMGTDTTTDLASVTISGNDITLAAIGGAASGVTGATSVTAATSGGDDGSITLNGTTYKTAGTQAYNAGAAGNLINVNGVNATFTTTGDNVTFTGTTTLANNAGANKVTVTTAGTAPDSGNITMGAIRGTLQQNLTLNANLANISVGAIGNANEIMQLIITGATTTLGGNITTTNDGTIRGDIDINGNVVLGDSVSIVTNNVNTADGGNIDISLATSASDVSHDLTINTSSSNMHGGFVTLGALSNGGGSYIDDLSITTTGNSGHSSGDISLQAVRTTSTQSYNTAGASGAANGTVTLNGNLTTTNSAITFAANTPVTLGAAVTLTSGTGKASLQTVNNGGYLLTMDNTTGGTASEIAGAVSGSGGLTKSGTGTLTLSGSNTYAGGTTLTAGTLNINNAGALGTTAGSAFVINGGTTIDNTNAGFNTPLSVAKIQTWNGNFTFKGTNDLDMSTGAITLTDNVTITTDAHMLVEGGVVSGNTFNINHVGPGTLSFQNAITTTSGSVTNTSGTLALGGDGNTYTGGINLIAGTLNINSDTALGAAASTFTIGNGSTIDNTAFAGGHSVSIANANSITINGDFTFTGSCAGNDLDLGTGAVALGAATRTIALNALNLTFGGIIGGGAVGTGLATTDGGGHAGKLTLNGVNTYTGATTIGAGTTLALGAAGKIENSSGVANSGTFTIAVSKTIQALTGAGATTLGANTLTIGDVVNNRSGTYTGAIGGTGNIATIGTGTLTLSGASAYSGTTTIGAGSTIQASSAGALGASAVTNSLANGTLDIGTIALALGAGSYTQGGATSTLKLAANSSSAFGTITSAGVNAITDGVVSVTVGGYIPNGATLAILTGGAGSAYAPATIASSNPYITFSGSTANNIYTLTAVRSGSNSFSGQAANSNGAAVGNVLDNVTNPTSDMTTILNTLTGLNPSGVDSALNSMEPDANGAALQVIQSTLDQLTEAILGHQASLRNSLTGVSTGDDMLKGLDVWAQVFGSYLHQDPRQLSQGYNATIWGTALGFDIPAMSDIRVGTCFGFAQDFVRGKDNSNRNNINSYQWTIYGEYAKDAYYIDLSGAFALNTYDASRQVAVGGINRTASSDYNGQQYQLYIEGGYTLNCRKDLKLKSDLNITPLASFQYEHLYLEKYTETGANAMNLTVKAQNYDLAQTGFGVKFDYPFNTKYGQFVPELRFKWLYDWIGDAQATTSNFSGGGGSFATNGFNPAQSSWDFGAKVTMFTKNNWELATNYDFELKEDFYGHYGYVNAKYNF